MLISSSIVCNRQKFTSGRLHKKKPSAGVHRLSITGLATLLCDFGFFLWVFDPWLTQVLLCFPYSFSYRCIIHHVSSFLRFPKCIFHLSGSFRIHDMEKDNKRLENQNVWRDTQFFCFFLWKENVSSLITVAKNVN